jgi:ribonuclease P protein component
MASARRRCVLTGAGAFEAVFRAGRRREGEFIQLVSTAAARDCGRVGFVIGKKALPRAVDRNRVRRLLRVLLVGSRDALGGLDVIVRIKRGAPRTEFASMVAEASRLLATLAPHDRAP